MNYSYLRGISRILLTICILEVFLSEINNLHTTLSCAVACVVTTNCVGFFNHNAKSECKLMSLRLQNLTETQVSSGWAYFSEYLGKYHI